HTSLCTLTTSTLFPYTTLFRSRRPALHGRHGGTDAPGGRPHRICRHRPSLERGDDETARTDGLPRRLGRRRRSAGRTAENVLKRSEEHTSELQSRENLVCRLLL